MGKTRFSHAAGFGVAAAMAAIGLALAVYLLTNPLSGWNYLSYPLSIAVMCLGAMKWREQNGGYLTFGQTYVHLVLQSILYIPIMAIWTYVFFGIIAPGVVPDYLLMQEVQLEEQGLPQSQIDMTIDMMRSMMTPVGMVIWGTIFNVFVFGIVHLITAAIMKKDPPPAQFVPPGYMDLVNAPPQGGQQFPNNPHQQNFPPQQNNPPQQ